MASPLATNISRFWEGLGVGLFLAHEPGKRARRKPRWKERVPPTLIHEGMTA